MCKSLCIIIVALKTLCITLVALLIASDFEVKYAFYQHFFLPHMVREFLNIYYSKLITLEILEHEAELTESITLVKGINLMLTKSSFPHHFSLLFTLDLCHPTQCQLPASSGPWLAVLEVTLRF